MCSGYRWRKIISLVEFEPPGLNVKALTSSATILKELNFIENDGKIDPNVEEIDEKNINL